MRMIINFVGLLLVVAVIALLARKQLGGLDGGAGPARSSAAGVAAPTGTPRQQVEQVQKAVEGALQQPRPHSDPGQ